MGSTRTTTSLRMMRNAPSARQTSPEMRVSWLWNTPRSTTKYRTSCTAAQASTTPPSAQQTTLRAVPGTISRKMPSAR